MIRGESTHVARLLRAASRGDARAAGEVWNVVYGTLHDMARSRRLSSRASLQTTALVHEAYLKLARGARFDWQTLGRFYSAAGRAMRNILVDEARRLDRIKRPPDSRRVALHEEACATADEPSFLALHRALERLERAHARAAEVVTLRFFAGLENKETAKALGLSEATVRREWSFAKAWLYRELEGSALA